MRLSSSAIAFVLAVVGFIGESVQGFVTNNQLQNCRCLSNVSPLLAKGKAESEPNSLLDEFRLFNGELIDPYQVLKVSRKADRSEIRQKYINLSRRYHPDAAMHRDILPGSCNDEEDVRLHWERIKMSYEILSNRRTRTRYDRNVVISDPKAAMQRAAMDAAGDAAVGVASSIGKGVFAVGKGLFSMGAKAVAESSKKKEEGKQDDVAKA